MTNTIFPIDRRSGRALAAARQAPPRRLAFEGRRPWDGAALVETLTEREKEVLRLVAQGRSNKEIARELVVTEKTVKGHIGKLLSKLSLQNRTQAALFALRNGLATLDD